MGKEKLLKEANRLLRDVERYTGKKLPPITEEQLNGVRVSQKEWEKAAQKRTTQEHSYTDTEPFR